MDGKIIPHAIVLNIAIKMRRGRVSLSSKSRSENFLSSNESDVIPYQALDSAGERPMWKPEHRRAADRTGLRYPSDLSDDEWLTARRRLDLDRMIHRCRFRLLARRDQSRRRKTLVANGGIADIRRR